MNVKKVVIFLLWWMPWVSTAQSFSTKGWWSPAGAPFSPVVHADKRVTFRLKAANASVVNLLFGEWNVKPQSMHKDSANNWSITIDAVQPGIYSYVFSV